MFSLVEIRGGSQVAFRFVDAVKPGIGAGRQIVGVVAQLQCGTGRRTLAITATDDDSDAHVIVSSWYLSTLAPV
jgi:hypothetical protein